MHPAGRDGYWWMPRQIWNIRMESQRPHLFNCNMGPSVGAFGWSAHPGVTRTRNVKFPDWPSPQPARPDPEWSAQPRTVIYREINGRWDCPLPALWNQFATECAFYQIQIAWKRSCNTRGLNIEGRVIRLSHCTNMHIFFPRPFLCWGRTWSRNAIFLN